VPAVRVDVSREDGRVRFARADAPTRPLRAPLVLGPVARVTYADPSQALTLRSFLRNPYYVMMGVMGVMMIAMPRLMASIDPEELKAMQDEMGKGGTLGLMQGLLNGQEPPSIAAKKKKEGSGGGGGAAAGAAPGGGGAAAGGGGSAKKKPN
jgi:uncharacterized membrane protein YgcG